MVEGGRNSAAPGNRSKAGKCEEEVKKELLKMANTIANYLGKSKVAIKGNEIVKTFQSQL